MTSELPKPSPGAETPGSAETPHPTPDATVTGASTASTAGAGAATVFYRRSRFATRLPRDRRYTPAHYWLLEEEAGVWRVGLTGFATRMLGDLVEYDLSVKPGATIEVGQTIGSLEGFKAVAELYSVASGELVGGNPDLAQDITLVEGDPYRRGWLYRVRGQAADGHLDVEGYVAVLDATVDAMLKNRHGGDDADDAGDVGEQENGSDDTRDRDDE
jgi:glycine cleavage system H protein